MKTHRPDDALLAGVCAELSRRLGWNAWAIRGLFVLGLLINAVAAGVVYIVLALAMQLLSSGADRKSAPPGGLESPDLADRGRRIDELERQFRQLEQQAEQGRRASGPGANAPRSGR
jgi:phage shock protein PspC (stress-responsive transcriptional regulator)